MATKMEVNTDGRVRKRLTLKEKKEILRLYPKQENDKTSKKIHRKRKFEEVEEILLDFVEENNKREESAASQEVADNCIANDVPIIIQSYRNEHISNCDETGAQYRALPKKTLARKGQKKKGGKVNKERLSVLFCCSAAGKKLPPLVIENWKKPRIFTKVKLDIQKAGFSWYSTSTSWMKTDIFEEWLTNLNNSMKAQKRTIVLLLDNFSAHRVGEKSNVEVVFLPPNLTSKVQPLDKGIIASYKK
ncbi:hypothetical protein RvY_08721 [Ramazzottius varieornatus]|uniref:DDE-1 domain-containing protein n=1 Tax=Ramazzottius varieornatus TaxID=947166 RepID=A0A1D1V6V3_RAMVA|nr:hypothetical protein RvY_08721 [Ramazzottius varieornatus]